MGFFWKKGDSKIFDFSEKIWILDFLVGLKTALPLTKISGIGTFLIGLDTSSMASDPDLRLLDLLFTDILDLVLTGFLRRGKSSGSNDSVFSSDLMLTNGSRAL